MIICKDNTTVTMIIFEYIVVEKTDTIRLRC